MRKRKRKRKRTRIVVREALAPNVCDNQKMAVKRASADSLTHGQRRDVLCLAYKVNESESDMAHYERCRFHRRALQAAVPIARRVNAISPALGACRIVAPQTRGCSHKCCYTHSHVYPKSHLNAILIPNIVPHSNRQNRSYARENADCVT
jgi:hypothetical protein